MKSFQLAQLLLSNAKSKTVRLGSLETSFSLLKELVLRVAKSGTM